MEKYNSEWDTGAMYLNMQGQELHKCKTNIIFVTFFLPAGLHHVFCVAVSVIVLNEVCDIYA